MFEQRTEDYSVKFGQDPSLGLEGQKSFPFIFSLVNRNDDTWTPVTPGNQPSLANLGPLVPAASKLNHNVLLDPDYAFKLLSIRYGVNYWTPPTHIPGRYVWYENINSAAGAGGLSDGVDPDTDKVGTPLVRFMGISLSFQGAGSTTLYGGQDAGYLRNGQRIPLPADTIQGYDYGVCTMRTPFLLPRQGVLTFEFTNSHATKDLYVAAAIYGVKVRL